MNMLKETVAVGHSEGGVMIRCPICHEWHDVDKIVDLLREVARYHPNTIQKMAFGAE